MDYVEIGKIPPRSKSVMSSPQELVDRLQGLVGTKMQLTGKVKDRWIQFSETDNRAFAEQLYSGGGDRV